MLILRGENHFLNLLKAFIKQNMNRIKENIIKQNREKVPWCRDLILKIAILMETKNR